MAFRILSFEEQELLTENQRESYERELAIYNERVKFVEQVERLENTVIAPYELELAAIPAICEVPQEEFVEPEYAPAQIAPIVKPEPDVPEFHFGGPVTAVLPEHVIIKNIPVGHMRKVEQDKPILPTIFKAAAPANLFIKVEQQRPILPEGVKISVPDSTFHLSERTRPHIPLAVKPQNLAELCHTPITIDSPAISVNNPQPAMLVVEVSDFAAPEYAVPILPKMEVKFPKADEMVPPELEAPVLPKVAVPRQMDVSFQQMGEIKPELPGVCAVPFVKASFGKPNIQRTKLPAVPRAEMPTKEFTPAKQTAPELPPVGIPQSGISLYAAPQLSKPTVQEVVKPAVGPKLLFAAPEVPKPRVQEVVKPSEMPKPYDGKLSIDNTPKIEYPSITVLSVKPFEKIHSKASSLPTTPTVDSPSDCAEELLKIRLSLQREYGAKREGFA